VTVKLGEGVRCESKEQGPCMGATGEGKAEGTRTSLIQERGEGAELVREGATGSVKQYSA